MRVDRTQRFAVALLLVGALAASCSGGGGSGGDDDDDDDDGAGTLSFTVNGSGFTTYTGFLAVVRVLEGTTVVGCGASGPIGGAGDWSVTLPATLNSGGNYTAEAFANLGGGIDNSVYDSSTDGAYPLAAFTATSAFTWAVAEGQTGAITWPDGTGCP